jgi:hypothetical protein
MAEVPSGVPSLIQIEGVLWYRVIKNSLPFKDVKLTGEEPKLPGFKSAKI